MFAVSLLQASFAVSISIQGIIAQDSSPKGPTHPNIAANCSAYYTLESGDGCYLVETKYHISHADFIKWNPDVSEDCLTNFWLGSSYCVGVGAVASKSSPTRISATSTTSSGVSSKLSSSISGNRTSVTTTAPYSIANPIFTWNVSSTTIESGFPPKKTQAGQPSYCMNWHMVVAGETCQSIIRSTSGVTLEQFLEWNPAVDSDCSGLFDGWWVCIAIHPQSVTVTFDYVVTTGPVELPNTTIHTPTVFPTADSSFDPSPTRLGLVSDCKAFHKAKNGETCRQLVQYGLFSQEQFFNWNPALEGNCDGLWANYYYCVAAGDFLPAPGTVTKQPNLTPQGQISTCNSWYDADEYETCDEIVSRFGRFSKDDLVKWNPSIASSCAGLSKKQYVCVGVPGTPTTRTGPPLSTTAPPIEAPTQTGMIANCKGLWLVSRSDSCSSIAKINGISEKQLLEWNPAIGTSTCTNLKPDYYVCVVADGKP